MVRAIARVFTRIRGRHLLSSAEQGLRLRLLVDLHETAPLNYMILTPERSLEMRLCIERARHHLAQIGQSPRLGLPQQAYQKLQTFDANPTLATIVRLEQALGVALLRLA